MADQPAVVDIVKFITDDVKALVRGEIELAKSELVPAGKGVGGAAVLGIIALYIVFNLLAFLFLAGAFGWSLLFTFESTVVNLLFGFLCMAGCMLIIAAILGAIIYFVHVPKIKAPEATIAQAKATGDAVKASLDRGQTQVAAIGAQRAAAKEAKKQDRDLGAPTSFEGRAS
ncbi:phage holin family protein [Parenemella sanctibonifatiensis]|uniref:Phage holin family protein n=1 Tax=Parenemella sanctibonifatiensis TaxID=2016505 RepID=A0A255DZS1_9ACTN|nr:phage holin family protein [Parenemella sanctibonifatiensis]OYN84580.1 hypothetical protein CGZ92_12120 [Parenemella sanctibonifatiensis]